MRSVVRLLLFCLLLLLAGAGQLRASLPQSRAGRILPVGRYDLAGGVAVTTLPNEDVIATTYDPLNGATAIEGTSGPGQQLYRYGLLYDGGEIHPTKGETGIDVFNEPLDKSRPHVTFKPKPSGNE